MGRFCPFPVKKKCKNPYKICTSEKNLYKLVHADGKIKKCEFSKIESGNTASQCEIQDVIKFLNKEQVGAREIH